MQFSVGFAVINDDFRGDLLGSGGSQPVRASSDLEPGVCATEGFTDLTGEELGQRLRGSFHRVGCPVEVVSAFFAAQCRPRGLGFLGAGNRCFQVRHVMPRGLTDGLFGGGRCNGDRVAIGGDSSVSPGT